MKFTDMTGFPRPQDQTLPSSSSSCSSNSSGKNVFNLLAHREISARSKHVPKQHWGEASEPKTGSCPHPKNDAVRDSKRSLLSWVEAESLRHLSAKYCSLLPPPRSTIAAAFSPDGKVLASTHGDHTVKIIDWETGSCLNVLIGHRRTPWVVRFHPLQPHILASGSLDQEVRLWDANTSKCILFHHFYRPIASIAFHAEGEILAIASGHKLYIWHYNKRGEGSSPTSVLKTRRSLRAVHFHPHAAPYLLTAEVNDLDSSDSSMTRATSPGYLQYPPPAVIVANIHFKEHIAFPSSELPYLSLPFFFLPSSHVDDSRMETHNASLVAGSENMQVESASSAQFQAATHATEQYNNTVSPMDTVSEIPSTFSNGMGTGISNLAVDVMDTDETVPAEGSQHENSTNVCSLSNVLHGLYRQTTNHEGLSDLGQFHRFFPSRDPSGWELPFLQGWLMGQSQVGVPLVLPHLSGSRDSSAQNGSSIMASNLPLHDDEATTSSSANPGSTSIPGALGRSGLRSHFPQSQVPASDSGNMASSISIPYGGTDIQTIISRIQSELATSVAAAAAELPCTVKLRVWSHDIKDPCASLSTERCHLTIPHAVLCSEMGAHFSPCGRFLAACVACMLPHVEADSGLQAQVQHESGVATSPTRHPISAHQVMYELRIYSLEEATFGMVLASRAIRAAHCLTSIQVYRVSDMKLVMVLPSAEDEVNVACFHPFPGRGLVYGTKEGKLRVLHYDGAHAVNGTKASYLPEDNIIGVN
ncbi:uncharacterized protein LOC129312118 isoform X2 [Prosopis cineraria]|uniref:uncharacterized protein LOC129312118 isoform X2 n=1 Tax=Prosopis cineraria TaxID=364024 RepID=UPI00240F9D59|nr:uncharacterized protein LOC129312118 isoform X2 [Prosopis cineraria]